MLNTLSKWASLPNVYSYFRYLKDTFADNTFVFIPEIADIILATGYLYKVVIPILLT